MVAHAILIREAAINRIAGVKAFAFCISGNDERVGNCACCEPMLKLGIDYPPDIFSLSHIALPFPVTDPLYGTSPDTDENFNVNLGALAARGERGALILTLDAIFRIASNPFFPYVEQRIDEGMGKKPGPVIIAPERFHQSAEGVTNEAVDELPEVEPAEAYGPCEPPAETI